MYRTWGHWGGVAHVQCLAGRKTLAGAEVQRSPCCCFVTLSNYKGIVRQRHTVAGPPIPQLSFQHCTHPYLIKGHHPDPSHGYSSHPYPANPFPSKTGLRQNIISVQMHNMVAWAAGIRLIYADACSQSEYLGPPVKPNSTEQHCPQLVTLPPKHTHAHTHTSSHWHTHTGEHPHTHTSALNTLVSNKFYPNGQRGVHPHKHKDEPQFWHTAKKK